MLNVRCVWLFHQISFVQNWQVLAEIDIDQNSYQQIIESSNNSSSVSSLYCQSPTLPMEVEEAEAGGARRLRLFRGFGYKTLLFSLRIGIVSDGVKLFFNFAVLISTFFYAR